MLRLRPLLALTLAGCAAAAAPSPSTLPPQTPTHTPPAPSPSENIPWEGEALKQFDWATLAPPAPKDRSDQFLTIAVPNAPNTWDPHKAYDDVDRFLARSLFEGLVTRHPKTCQPIPAIAEWWDVSPDRKVYTFHLRADARWSDGTTITAADVKWSLARALDEATDSPGRALLGPMLPAAAIAGLSGGEAEGGGPATELQVVSERTLRITLARPEPRLLHALAEPGAVVVHRATVEAHGKKAFDAEHFMTSGAFLRGAALEGGATVLTRNKNHWMHERTWLSSVVLTWPKEYGTPLLPRFASGAVDWVPWCYESDRDGAAKADGRYDSAGSATQFLLINPWSEGGDKQGLGAALRRALAATVDRDSLAPLLGGGSASTPRLVPAGTPGYPPLKPAMERTTGLKRGEEGGRLTLLAADYPPIRAAAGALAEGWKAGAGLTLDIQTSDARSLRGRIEAGDFQLAIAGHYEPLPHPLGVLESPLLRWIWKNDDGLRAGLQRARALPPAEALAACADLEELIVQDRALVIPLTRNRFVGLLRPGVAGLTPNVLNEHRLRYLRVMK